MTKNDIIRYGLTPETRTRQQRDRLVNDNIRLARAIASRSRIRQGSYLTREDLESEALIGLTMAASRWDATTGIRFSTYAYAVMWGWIQRAEREASGLPSRVYTTMPRVLEVETRLASMGFDPTPDRVSDIVGESISAEEIATAHSVSLGMLEIEEVEESTGRTPTALISPAETERVTDAFHLAEHLPGDQRTVIHQLYRDELSLEEIARRMGVSRKMASRLRDRALQSMRRMASA